MFNWVAAASNSISPWGFSHLWSLSVEEQFYFLWPAFLLACLKMQVPFKVMAAGCVALILASASMPLILSHASYAPLYYGTDFRIQELMFGSLFALLTNRGILNDDSLRLPLVRLCVAGSVLFFAYWFFALNDGTAFIFDELYLVAAFAASWLVLACAMMTEGWTFLIMANPVVRYVGKRSYALYLWHMPINFWLRGFPPVPHFVLAVALSFLVAEASYWLVERPCLRVKKRFASLPLTLPVTSAAAETLTAA